MVRESKLWYDYIIMVQSGNAGQDIFENAEMGGLTPPRRTLDTLLHPTTIYFDRWHTACLISISTLMTSQKMDRFVGRLKRRIVFSRWYPTIARKIEKSIVPCIGP